MGMIPGRQDMNQNDSYEETSAFSRPWIMTFERYGIQPGFRETGKPEKVSKIR